MQWVEGMVAEFCRQTYPDCAAAKSAIPVPVPGLWGHSPASVAIPGRLRDALYDSGHIEKCPAVSPGSPGGRLDGKATGPGFPAAVPEPGETKNVEKSDNYNNSGCFPRSCLVPCRGKFTLLRTAFRARAFLTSLCMQKNNI